MFSVCHKSFCTVKFTKSNADNIETVVKTLLEIHKTNYILKYSVKGASINHVDS